MFNLSRSTWLVVSGGLMVCILLIGTAIPAMAQTTTLLGTAQSFAVLGDSTVTNTGPSTVSGDLGVSPGTAVTGFPPGIVIGGTIHAADEVASQAQSDVTTAYNTLAGLDCDFALTGQDLGGKTLVPGVYCFTSSAQLTGALTLNAVGDPDALFVFQIASTLTTASNSSVLIIGGSACNVFWQVGSSATLGTTTSFQGNILALTSITLNTGADVIGRALAQNGAVTMDTNDVSAAGCATETEEPTPTQESLTATPEDATPTPETPTATATPGRGLPGTPPDTIPGLGGPSQATPTPDVPGPIVPEQETPAPEVPNPLTPTPVTPLPETATPLVPADETATPSAPAPATETRVSTTPTPKATVGPSSTPRVTATPSASATPTLFTSPTSTPVANVKFPNTGSAGLLAAQNDQSFAVTNLAISIAIVVVLTGGLGIFVERRSRH